MNGEFDREAYRFALEQAGTSEGQFEDNLRAQEASTILQTAALGNVFAPESYTNTLLRYLAEERDITWAVLDRDDLATGVPVPSDADLTTFHDENPDLFTLPETKRITYAWLTPDMIVDTVEIEESTLRAAYDERIEDYADLMSELQDNIARYEAGEKMSPFLVRNETLLRRALETLPIAEDE